MAFMRFYNLKQLQYALKELGHPLAYLTVYNYVKKGMVKPIGTTYYRGRSIGVFNDESLYHFIKLLEDKVIIPKTRRVKVSQPSN